MARNLVPELHDIFKLTRYGHIYPDFPFLNLAPNTKSWEGITKHHCSRNFELYPDSPELFLLCIADSLAASVSRPSADISYEEGGRSFAISKLWNPGEKEDPRILSDEEIKGICNYLANDPSAEAFLNKFRGKMILRSEDSNPGKNITSLYTHSILTGKIYRILSSNPAFLLKEEDFIGKQKDDVQKMISEKSVKEWKLTTIWIKFNLMQQPFRAVDLNIFLILKEILDTMQRKFANNIMLKTSNELLLLAVSPNLIDEIKDACRSKNIWLESTFHTKELNELEPDPNLARKSKKENIYLDLADTIEPPICQICQMAKATKIWKKEPSKLDDSDLLESAEEPGIEKLCEACYEIRSMGVKLKKLQNWFEKGEDKVAWIKISLSFEELINALQILYKNYINESAREIRKIDTKIRFSVIHEFQMDFDSFIRDFSSRLVYEFKQYKVEEILSDFFCVSLSKYKDLLKILNIYNELLKKFFPKFIDIDISPLKLNIVASRAKFPFFEVWKIINNPVKDINIALANRGRISTKNRSLEQLLNAGSSYYRKSSLEHLAEIAKISEPLAKLRFEHRYDRKDKDKKTYQTLRKSLMDMDFQSILTFSKILAN